MAIYLTEYKDKEGYSWSGPNLEATSFDAAQQSANLLARLESSIPDCKFSCLIVLGELVDCIGVEDNQAHSVKPMTCAHCDREWVAVFPSQIEFVDCPYCRERNQV